MIRTVLAPIGFASTRRWEVLRAAHNKWDTEDALSKDAAPAAYDPGPPQAPKRAILPPGGSSAFVASLYRGLYRSQGRPAPRPGYRQRREKPTASGNPPSASELASGVVAQAGIPASPVAPLLLQADARARDRLLRLFTQQVMAAAA